MVLRRGHYVRLTVKRAAGRAEDHLAHAVINASLEEVDTADDVHRGVKAGVRYGLRHLRLRCMVAHQLRPECRNSFFHLWLIAQVHAVYGRGRVDVVLAPRAEVIEDGDLMAGGAVRVDDM